MHVRKNAIDPEPGRVTWVCEQGYEILRSELCKCRCRKTLEAHLPMVSCWLHRGRNLPRGSYPTPFLGYHFFYIPDPNHKARYPKKGVGYDPLSTVRTRDNRGDLACCRGALADLSLLGESANLARPSDFRDLSSTSPESPIPLN